MLLLGRVSSALAAVGLAAASAGTDTVSLVQRPAAADLYFQADLARQVDGPSGRSQRQELHNFKDLQYYAEVYVGTPPQKLTGVIDTGSFELVLFSKQCEDCGSAVAYDAQLSSSHRSGNLANSLTYGSGDIQAIQSWDRVSIGPFDAKEQYFWEGLEASMPVLANARFQSIIGIGPPETPAADAWAFTKSSIAHVNRYFKKFPGTLPPDFMVSDVMRDLSTALRVSSSKPLLSNFEVRMFSVCLGKRPQSSGFFVWNDTTALREPSLFHRLPVVGRHTWTVRMSSVHLLERSPMPPELAATFLPGCETGCGAIVDSGTSLLVMPSKSVDAFVNILSQRIGSNCSNIHQLPDIVFTLNGIEVSLTPDSYMAQVSGSVPVFIEDVVRIRRVPLLSDRSDSGQCEVAVMESFTQSDYGPLWILGMPFFRKYYTTFDLGTAASERSVHVALASDACTPVSPEVPVAVAQRPGYVHRREIDLAHVMVPSMLRKASQKGFVSL